MRQNILTMTVVLGIAGALAAATFGGGLLVFVALGNMSGAVAPGNGLLYVAVAVAGGVVAPALGLTAAWHGWRGLRGKPSAPFKLAPWGLFLLALIVTLAAGQAAFSAGIDAVAVFAHALAATLAALLMLALPVGAARRHGWTVGRRAGATSLAWGGLGGIGLAIMLEVMAAVALIVAVAVAVAVLRPGLLEQLGGNMDALPLTPDADPLGALGPLLSSPWVLLGGLLVMSVIVPVIEELCKSLAVPLVKLAGRPLTRLDAFLLGAAAGAGFTLIEGITNGATALAQPEGWALAMAARSGVAVIHVLASGLAGLAWHAGLVERNWRRGIGLFTAAVALHGVWNGGALLTAWLGLRMTGEAGLFSVALGSVGAVAVVGGMGVVFVGSLILLAALPGKLIERRLN